MISRVQSGAVLGIDGYPVEVEVNLAMGIPGMSIVGLPDAAVKEIFLSNYLSKGYL